MKLSDLSKKLFRKAGHAQESDQKSPPSNLSPQDNLTKTQKTSALVLERLLDTYEAACGSGSLHDALQTLRKNAEHLEDSERLLLDQIRMFRAVFNNMDDGVAVCDRDGHALMMNPAGEKFVELEKYGCYLPDKKTSYLPEDLPMARALKGEEVRGVEIFIRNEKKPYGIWLSVNAKPLKDSTGTILGGICTFQEISQRKGAEGRGSEYRRAIKETSGGPAPAAPSSSPHSEAAAQSNEAQPRHSGVLNTLATVATLTAVYFVAGKLGLRLAYVHPSATAVWPPTGIAIATFLLLGYRVWPAIFLGAFLTNVTTMGSIPVCLGIALGNTLEGLAGAYLTRKFANGPQAFNRPQGIFRFVFFAGFAATMISSTIGVTSLSLGGFSPWAHFKPVWLTWWLGDACGAIVFTPAILLWSKSAFPSALPFRWNPRRVLETVLFFALLCLTGLAVFNGTILSEKLGRQFPFLTVPLLIWVAFRFGQRESAAATLTLSIIAIWGTLRHQGPFGGLEPNASFLFLQAFAAICTTMTMTMAALTTGYRRSEETLKQRHDELEKKVGEGTQELVGALEALRSEMSERELVAKELRERDERFHLLIDGVKDHAIFALDPEGRVTSWNEGAKRIKGYRAEEIIGKNFSCFYPEEDIRSGKPRELLRRTEAEGRCEEEGWQVRKDGSKFWASVTITALRDEQGRLRGYAKVTRDTTESKHYQERLRKLSRAVEHSSSIVMITDCTGNIEYVNPKFIQVTGYALQEVLGKNPRLLKSGLVSPEVYKQLWETILSGKEWRGELQNKRKNGEPYWASQSISPIKNSEGVITHFVAIQEDVTERKQAQEALLKKTAELAHAQAEREQLELFTHLASHDLQAPLQKIVGFGDLLEAHSSASLDEKGLQFLNRMREGALRMSQLMDGLVEFAKAALKEKPFGPVDLQGIMSDVLSDLEIRILKTKAQVDTGALPTVQADKIQMHELFLNLVSNAIKFHKKDEPPRVFIKGEFAGNNGCVKITVEDNGIGFDDARADKIFKPFERLCSKEDGYEGIGMGLAICKRIVLRHNGEIKVKSAPGKGTLFTVTLPVAQNFEQRPQ